jgi:hypothetical protein
VVKQRDEDAKARVPRSYRWRSAVDDLCSASIWVERRSALVARREPVRAITGSAQGANGTDMTAVADVIPDGIRWTGFTAFV